MFEKRRAFLRHTCRSLYVLYQILSGHDHTTMLLIEDKQHLMCRNTSASHACGQDNKPPALQQTDSLILLSASMDPQGLEASVCCLNQWWRNKYTVNGSYYFVWLKVEGHPSVGE